MSTPKIFQLRNIRQPWTMTEVLWDVPYGIMDSCNYMTKKHGLRFCEYIIALNETAWQHYCSLHSEKRATPQIPLTLPPPSCVSHLRHTSEPEKLFLRGGKRSSEGHFPEKLWPISRSPSPRRPLGRDWCPKKEKRGRYRMGGSGGGDKKREEKSRRGSEKGPLLARRHICGHLVPF